jgi:hypothetical protein
MSKFTFPLGATNEAFCQEIVRAMVFFFALTEDEAIARINQQWGHTTFADDELLFTQTPDHWAKWIYFGERSWYSFDSTLVTAQSRMERKLDFILEHLGITYPATPDYIHELIQQDKKMEAIILYHKHTGVSLKHAKEEIEKLIAQLPQSTNNP